MRQLKRKIKLLNIVKIVNINFIFISEARPRVGACTIIVHTHVLYISITPIQDDNLNIRTSNIIKQLSSIGLRLLKPENKIYTINIINYTKRRVHPSLLYTLDYANCTYLTGSKQLGGCNLMTFNLCHTCRFCHLCWFYCRLSRFRSVHVFYHRVISRFLFDSLGRFNGR